MDHQIAHFLSGMDSIENEYLGRRSGFERISISAEMFDELLDFVDDLCEREDE